MKEHIRITKRKKMNIVYSMEKGTMDTSGYIK